MDLIQTLAKRLNIKASISKCNPNAGDPADCYDVDFIPACCGKDEILFFLCDELNVSKNNTWAFGDSFNDFPMLKNAGNAYLVGNADAVAKKQFNSVLNSNYCFGIKTKLEEILK
jgi:kanosamine-6-phosphate phosphatase